MLCPFCREKDTSVVDSRPTEDGTAIRREDFVTVMVVKDLQHLKEFSLENLRLLKKTEEGLSFDREKLAKSFFVALKKDLLTCYNEKVVSRITRELEELGQSEIQSNVIGKKVMDALRELDKVAYIRFASVYSNFKEIGEFGEYIEELDGKSKK